MARQTLHTSLRPTGKTMRILIHEYCGHGFYVPLSRTLARRGHQVLHVNCASAGTPQGALQRRPEDAAGLQFEALRVSQRIEKVSLLKRWRLQGQYAPLLMDLVRRYQPEIVFSANTPTPVQARLLKECRHVGSRLVTWVQDMYGLAVYEI